MFITVEYYINNFYFQSHVNYKVVRYLLVSKTYRCDTGVTFKI